MLTSAASQITDTDYGATAVAWVIARNRFTSGVPALSNAQAAHADLMRRLLAQDCAYPSSRGSVVDLTV